MTRRHKVTDPLIPKTLKELEEILDVYGWNWEVDNYGGIVIYTGLKVGPKGLEPYTEQSEVWSPTDEY